VDKNKLPDKPLLLKKNFHSLFQPPQKVIQQTKSGARLWDLHEKVDKLKAAVQNFGDNVDRDIDRIQFKLKEMTKKIQHEIIYPIKKAKMLEAHDRRVNNMSITSTVTVSSDPSSKNLLSSHTHALSSRSHAMNALVNKN
jgi:hypothetical protein